MGLFFLVYVALFLQLYRYLHRWALFYRSKRLNNFDLSVILINRNQSNSRLTEINVN